MKKWITIVRFILALFIMQVSFVVKAAESWSVQELMQTMSQIDSCEAKFEEA